MTEKNKRNLRRGAISIGLSLTITLVALAAGAVWKASTALNVISNAEAITAAKEAEHEAQDIRATSQLNDTVSKMDDKITLLLRSQGITASQISSVSAKK